MLAMNGILSVSCSRYVLAIRFARAGYPGLNVSSDAQATDGLAEVVKRGEKVVRTRRKTGLIEIAHQGLRSLLSFHPRTC